jgi:hypothetical protein
MSILLLLGIATIVIAFAFASRFKRNSRLASIFEKTYQLLQDEEMQNALYPSNLQSLLKPDNASRQVSDLYGIDITDPIRANGPLGELLYISGLRHPSGASYLGHRLGSLRGIDVYEVVSDDFRDWRIIFFDMYWSSKDTVAPKDLSCQGADAPPKGQFGLSATNRFISTFPIYFWENLIQGTQAQFGFPAVKMHLKSLNYSRAKRPDQHLESLQKTLVAVRAEGFGEDS